MALIDKRQPARSGPKKLTGVRKDANKIGKGIKPPKGIHAGDNIKNPGVKK